MATLKELREENALSQADLAALAKVAKSTIGSIENKHHKPNFKTRRKLAEALKVKPKEIEFW
ncbi:MAG: helix-turn-helix transcriptional regulator [Dehalococcoidia bacterium]|nr:helix-turn-helix transcriptional regulator [Dehalococcoidia bacterium]